MLKIVICYDEKENINLIYKIVKKLISEKYAEDNIEIFTAKPATLLNYKITDNFAYLFILDAAYKEVSGIDVAISLRHQHKSVYIVFAAERLELLYPAVNRNIMPSGFLKYPPESEELRRIIDQVIGYYTESEQKTVKTLTVNTGAAVYNIGHSEIYYIEALNKKIHIYTKTNKISFYHSLQALEKELGEGFIRCHKSFIVNKSKIKNIFTAEMFVEMENGSKIPISKTYKGNLK